MELQIGDIVAGGCGNHKCILIIDKFHANVPYAYIKALSTMHPDCSLNCVCGTLATNKFKLLHRGEPIKVVLKGGRNKWNI